MFWISESDALSGCPYREGGAPGALGALGAAGAPGAAGAAGEGAPGAGAASGLAMAPPHSGHLPSLSGLATT